VKRTLLILRAMKRTGEHLHGCFADAGKRAEGWRLIQRANRAARRLGVGGLL
jgi:hypothetical protein